MRTLVAILVVTCAAAAHAQPTERTVRPRAWPEAGRWPVPAWVVVALGVALVLVVLVGLVRHLRRSRR